MRIGVLKEIETENRVAILPEHIEHLKKLRLEVMIEKNAGIENFLFFDDKTRMLFGNAKDSLQKLVTEIKSL